MPISRENAIMASPALLMPKPRGGFLTVKVCKLPAQFDTDMIACDVCDKWFHCSCVSVHPVNIPEYSSIGSVLIDFDSYNS